MREIFAAAGFPVCVSTIRNWEARVKSNTPAVSVEKETGRSALLSDEQQDLLVGYVLHKNFLQQQIDGKGGDGVGSVSVWGHNGRLNSCEIPPQRRALLTANVDQSQRIHKK